MMNVRGEEEGGEREGRRGVDERGRGAVGIGHDLVCQFTDLPVGFKGSEKAIGNPEKADEPESLRENLMIQ